ncbi:MAG TPA: ATP-binding protein [Crinalium sp.]
MSPEFLESSGEMNGRETPAEGYECLMGGGAMGTLMRSFDWSKTLFGPVEQWPQSLRSALSICLNSRFPIAIYWGPDCLLLYNDAWRPIVGDKHPWSLGRPGREVWPEIWEDIGPEFATVLGTGEGIFHSDELLAMHRFGYTEECFFDYTFNPIQGEGGVIDGIFNVVSETTYRVLNDRRAQLLRELASRTGIAKTVEDACELMTAVLKSDPKDIPFSLLYLIHPDERQAFLYEGTNAILSHPAAPKTVTLDVPDREDVWAIAQVAQTAQSHVIDDLVARFGTLPGSPWPEPPQEAMVLPIATPGQAKIFGVLVAVASPRRRLDNNYRSFFGQVAGQMATAIANARSYEEERQRAEQLAELDRAKTIFFSNVSHEFRTPLTLILGPAEDALRDAENGIQRDRLELIHRNALRLQKLVNTLLDFSRIEAGRIEAVYEPTDLAMLTTDLAGVFRSTIERAGMHLTVDCPPLPEPIYIDRDMWEKIVLNLLSNAFKFTFEGEISVRLHQAGDRIELAVQDTGIGIPAAELPHLFERFHRVKEAQGRSFEGSGIGLSLVQELVKLHSGKIHVSSTPGVGTCFTIAIPTGIDHLPQDRIKAARNLSSTALDPTPYLEEAQRWLPDDADVPVLSMELSPDLAIPSPTAKRHSIQSAQILLVEDNADMRDYVKRLLSQHYEVTAVADGVAALASIREQVPDLVLTDVMMPNLDGFGLLKALRADPQTREVPIILLSARAGEEARVEGLEAGADDYLIKPFSARELLARVEATLKLSQLRQEATRREQTQRQEVETAKAQLEAVLSGISDQFLVLDQEWRYIYVNDRVVETVGLSRDALLGKSIWELFPEVVGSEFEQQLRGAIAEQQVVHFEYYYSLWNRWFENHVYPSSEGITLFVTEITDRKRAELEREQLLIRERHYFKQLHGLTKAAVAINSALSSETVLQVITDQAAAIIGAHQSVTSLTIDHNWSQAITAISLSDKYAQWRDYDEKPDGSGIYACVCHLNRSMRMTQAELEAHPRWQGFGKEADRHPPMRGWLAAPLVNREGQNIGLIQLSDKLEGEFSEADEAILVQLAQMASVAIEKAQLYEAEQQARTAAESSREEAQAANRIKDEFLAVLSHELRSPLNPILGWSRLLQSGRLDPSRTQQALATIERNAKLQSELIEDLLDVSRILQGKLSLTVAPIHLTSIIKAAIETVRLAADAKSIRIETTLDAEVGKIAGDATRLQQVIWNLLSNAVKFTPNGGRIGVRLEVIGGERKIGDGGDREDGGDGSFLTSPPSPSSPPSPPLSSHPTPDTRHPTPTTPSFAQITVSDTGRGISRDFLPYVFDYFRQADSATTRKFGGLGLGLSIVRHLVELHGGTIQADSPGEGMGATFTVRLPLLPAHLPEPSEVQALHSSLSLKGIRVLVVDDDTDTREIVTFLLEQVGAEAIAVGSAQEVLAAMPQVRPDILLSDIGMPDMDGYMLLQQIRTLSPEQGGQTPAIALTAYAGELNQQQALAAGFQQHISKPVEPAELVKAIAQLLRTQRTGN